MDAFNSYNQIKIDELDIRKISFIINQGLYCYIVMPFGLKNAGTTYHRLVNKIFKHLIGKNMEVYVDDILVKSIKKGDNIKDQIEAFEVLKKYKIKLNSAKCAFGVVLRKFLGLIISQRGIKANLDKIKALMDMAPSKSIKEVQKLTGRVTALRRFMS